MAPSRKFPQFCYSLIAGLSGLVMGVAVGWNSPAARLMVDDDTDLDCDSCDPITWRTAGSYCAGTAVGGLVQGPLSRTVGYRWAAVLCDLTVLAGWLLVVRAVVPCSWAGPLGPHTVCVGRVVQGLGAGALGLLTPAYITQVADCSVRGRAVVFHQVFMYFGVHLAYTLGAFLDYVHLVLFCMSFPVLHLLGALFIPESPCHMYSRGHCPEKIKSVVRRFKGHYYDADSDLRAIRKYANSSFPGLATGTSDRTRGSCGKRRTLRIWFIGIGLVAFQNLCGAKALAFHMELVMDQYKPLYDGSETVKCIAIAVSTLQLLACMVTVELVECLGRKCLLITSALGMGLCVVALTVNHAYWTANQKATVSTEWQLEAIIPIVLTTLYVCMYSIGWGPVTMLVYTEVVRFDMWFSSVIYAGGQVATLLLAYTFFTTDGLTGGHGSYVPYVYVTSCTAGAAFVQYYVPHTRVNLTRMADVLDDAYGPGDRGGGGGRRRERYDASSRADGRPCSIRTERRLF